MASILFIIPILVVTLIIFIIAGIKAESQEGGEEDLIKNVYIYLVLFATLMMTIGGSVAAFMAMADIVAPVPYYQTFEEYKRLGGYEKPVAVKDETIKTQLSEEELRNQYDTMVASEKNRQIGRAKHSLVQSLGWIVIPLPVFIYFQRRLSRKEG